ncbi:MAG TPA: tautomerase family protein [Alphaproteobacteria bacterium]|nr:tautomerase family protein [Alphaproteobacteria bacterium]
MKAAQARTRTGLISELTDGAERALSVPRDTIRVIIREVPPPTLLLRASAKNNPPQTRRLNEAISRQNAFYGRY